MCQLSTCQLSTRCLAVLRTCYFYDECQNTLRTTRCCGRLVHTCGKMQSNTDGQAVSSCGAEMVESLHQTVLEETTKTHGDDERGRKRRAPRRRRRQHGQWKRYSSKKRSEIETSLQRGWCSFALKRSMRRSRAMWWRRAKITSSWAKARVYAAEIPREASTSSFPAALASSGARSASA